MSVALNYPSIDTTHIVKWHQNIHIKVHGEPSSFDFKSLQLLVEELNDLLPSISLCLNETDYNMHLYFTSPQTFQQVEGYFKDVDNPILNGVTFVYHDSNYQIHKANLLVSSRTKNPQKRRHTIREELTQSLGLLTDSWDYPNSIFYEGQSYTTSFATIDQELIQILYRTDIEAGATAQDVLQLLCGK